MARVIFRRLLPEDGVWGILAASSLAAVLLAVLALALDLSAASTARTLGQAALDASLRSAAHDIAPDSVASSAPSIAAPLAAAEVSRTLGRLLPPPLRAQVTHGPAVQGHELSAAIVVSVPLPVLLGTLRIPLQGKVAVGWLPH